MGLMNAFAGLAQGLGAYGQAADRTAMLNLQEERQRYMMERERAEAERIRRAEMQQGVDNTAILRTINPTGYAEAYGDMGNRPSSVTAPSAKTQLDLFKVQESKRQAEEEAAQQKLKSFAAYWYLNGGPQTDPTGEKFMSVTGRNPFELVPESVLNSSANRDFQREMKQEGYRQAQILAGMRGGGDGNVGTWSLTPDGRARMNNKTGEIVPLGETYAKPSAAGGNPFDKEFGKKAAQDYFKLQDSAEKAQMSMAGLKAAEDAINRGIYTGIGGEAVQTGRKILGSMGMANKDDVAAAEELVKLQNEMALIARNPDSGMGLPGAASDRDVQFLKDMQFGLGRSPEANKRFIEAARRVKQRQIEIADAASKYIQENGTLDQNFYSQLRSFSQANPMFADMEEAPSPQAGGGTRQKVGPRPGTVVDGYEYLGGDPNDQRSWRPANGK